MKADFSSLLPHYLCRYLSRKFIPCAGYSSHLRQFTCPAKFEVMVLSRQHFWTWFPALRYNFIGEQVGLFFSFHEQYQGRPHRPEAGQDLRSTGILLGFSEWKGKRNDPDYMRVSVCVLSLPKVCSANQIDKFILEWPYILGTHNPG